MFASSTGNLEREITFTTLGWLQSAFWQCVFTHLWACGMLPMYTSFFTYPCYSVLVLMAMTYWREIHFYCAHRGMHPWFDREKGLLDGDVGAFLYRHVHSLHHKSYNPGPWSGLCMHPVEHFLYYSCATLPPLFLCIHPMHFLYCKFHADIAPIAGHDGMDDPGGNGDFHWLHHAKFECNYGVPFPINLDKLFGTWADYRTFKETGELSVADSVKNRMHEPEEDEIAEASAATIKTANGQTLAAPLLGAEPAKTFSMEEVAQHKTRGDCWIVLYGQVLDVTKFIDEHPGGVGVILGKAGKDATAPFESIHASSGGFGLVKKHAPDATLGVVSDYAGPKPPEPAEAGPSKHLGALFLFPLFFLVAASVLFHT
jgi:sterol desaturase/sphingolipid hydroxylase (fatty acid hydroxylase superfamily)